MIYISKQELTDIIKNNKVHYSYTYDIKIFYEGKKGPTFFNERKKACSIAVVNIRNKPVVVYLPLTIPYKNKNFPVIYNPQLKK